VYVSLDGCVRQQEADGYCFGSVETEELDGARSSASNILEEAGLPHRPQRGIRLARDFEL
jgi:hypothetical protein